MVVRMHLYFPFEYFGGPAGDDFVYIHMIRSAGSTLESRQDKFSIVPSGKYFIDCFDDCRCIDLFIRNKFFWFTGVGKSADC